MPLASAACQSIGRKLSQGRHVHDYLTRRFCQNRQVFQEAGRQDNYALWEGAGKSPGKVEEAVALARRLSHPIFLLQTPQGIFA